MISLEFVKSREELIPTEVNAILKQGGANFLNGGTKNLSDSLLFIKYKEHVIAYIKNNNEVTLKKAVDNERQKLCMKCQVGLLEGACYCEKDLKRFVFCDYIRRSLL